MRGALKMKKLFVNIFTVLLFVFSITSYHQNALASPTDAQHFIEKISSSALSIITSNENISKKEQKLTNLFINSVDTKWIARFAMGKYWNESTEVQRNKYTEIYRKFILRGYIPKFKEYNNQKIKIIKAYTTDDNEYTVETKIIDKDGTTINIDYKIKKHENGAYMIFDVIAEGVSLITTQRSDFASVLSRDGIDALIARLSAKSTEN